ncbi:Nif11-like leader peptide family natural product precursor [Scytonema sp. NUACC26]|uniref:Nif11-like leader peptide family natural product precursor n=1 Tax=Scytonema sp. NUACC26 TaxID=3140176 RepID=UPI0034DBA5D9
MSKQAVQELFKVAVENERLLTKLETATSSLKFVEIAANYGYIFTEQEMMEILKEEGKTKENNDKTADKKKKTMLQVPYCYDVPYTYCYGVWVFDYLERHHEAYQSDFILKRSLSVSRPNEYSL